MIDRQSRTSLCRAACLVLATADPQAKVALTHVIARNWSEGRVLPSAPEAMTPPDQPARPHKPPLVAPRDVPKRRRSKPKILLHAVAHIELNAIDLAWDLIARFGGTSMPDTFLDDWVRVADEEAKHFILLQHRLQEMGTYYGRWPAHDGLWEAAFATRHDLGARLAIVPLVLEARGLDVTPMMIKRFKNQGDSATVAILETILSDEIGHVSIGRRWFQYWCQKNGHTPTKLFQKHVRAYFRGQIKPPFNDSARRVAGLSPAYYLPLVVETNQTTRYGGCIPSKSSIV